MSARSDERLEQYLAEVVTGTPEQTPVIIAEYDAAWPARFREEAARISAALEGRERRIEHIGSTSVPGLAAKPVVDILLVLDDPGDEASYLPALELAGYELRVREPEFWRHRMLRTPARDVHVHVFPPDSPEVERYLLFRDRLRGEAAEREMYESAKRRLAAQDWPSRDHYAQAKTEVVEAIIARARAAQASGTPGADGGGAPAHDSDDGD
jgi:GrpB-like predicted nucleotidyltransferase (UPF0157 family)